MKRLCVLLLICLSALVATPTIAANVVVFQDDFEGYEASSTWPNYVDYLPGTPPVGDPWYVAETAVGRIQVLSAPSGTNYYCAGPHGGNNYLQTWSQNQVLAAFVPTAGQDLIAQNKNLTLDMWVYKNLADGWNGLQSIGGYDRSSPDGGTDGRSFLLYFRQDGKLQYFDDGLIDTGITYTPDTWMHLVVEANFFTQTYDVTLNDQTVTGLNFDTPATNMQHVFFYGSTDVDVNCRAAFDDIVMSVGDFVAPVPGDANNDGYVNAADASRLADNWLKTNATWGMGDFNDDKVVNDIDATLMATNWGWTPGAAASVPEPSSLVSMIVMGLAGLAFGIRQMR